MIKLTLAEIADRLGGEIKGDTGTAITRVATLEGAAAGCISFLANSKYQGQLAQTRASAVILARESSANCPVSCIVTLQPYLYFARVTQWLNPLPQAPRGLHSEASSDSQIPESTSVAAGARIGRSVVLGNNVTIGVNCVVGDGVSIDDDSLLHSACIVKAESQIGKRAIIHPGAVIGADGFGFARDLVDASWVKIPQTGRVVIGDDVEIGANTCIDRGAIDDTVIEDGVKLDNLIQIAHNVRIGAHTAIAACVGIAGSTVIGKRCTIAGASSIMGHLVIADDVNISLATTVTRSILKPGVYTGTLPSMSHNEWKQNYTRLRHLNDMADKIRSLEKRLHDLEKSK